jgi:hypothetical protein
VTDATETLLFVYGTLRQGGPNHALLAAARLVGAATTAERYALFVDGIPFLAPAPAVHRVRGEVYAVDAATLAAAGRAPAVVRAPRGDGGARHVGEGGAEERRPGVRRRAGGAGVRDVLQRPADGGAVDERGLRDGASADGAAARALGFR